MTPAELEYYATPGVMTDLWSLAEHVDQLEITVESVCRIVQGLIVHPFWGQAYGVEDVGQRDDELQLRPAAKIIAKALEIDDRPIDVMREPGKRVLGNCRDFTTVAVALLRHGGIPARARCGFGAYFNEGKHEDHWVVERWDGSDWVLTDAQLDDFQQKWLKLPFDPMDVPRDQFFDAGRAWQLYRSGTPGELFGLSAIEDNGPHWIRGNLTKDVAAFNKVEMLPWDMWGIEGLTEPMPDEYFDAIADVTVRADFDDVRELYARDSRMQVPNEITSYYKGNPTKVHVFD